MELESQNTKTSQEDYFSCGYCKTLLSSVSDLKSHLLIEHGQKHKCEICGKVFEDHKNLEIHSKRIHKKIGNFKCVLCEGTFNSSAGLSYHKRGHIGLKANICDKCNKEFSSATYLKLHIKTVHEGKKNLFVTYAA